MGSLLALSWALLTSHCQVEAMPGFEFLRCAPDSHQSDESGDPCKDNGCCAIESAQYYAPRQYEVVPVIVVGLAPLDNFDAVERSLPKDISLGILTAAPPELPRSWQFSLRTALLPRAPSVIS